jgi:hypothetical protein
LEYTKVFFTLVTSGAGSSSVVSTQSQKTGSSDASSNMTRMPGAWSRTMYTPPSRRLSVAFISAIPSAFASSARMTPAMVS